MKEVYPYEPISPWWREPVDVQPTLLDDQQCDVVIIGGGYTGLSTAIQLRKAGVDVVVLEMGICGSGSSGRNAGHLTPTIGKDMPSLLKVFGSDKAKALIRFAEDAVHHTEAIIDEYDIDCEYRCCGNVMAAIHPSQEKGLRRSARIASQLGASIQFIEEKDMRAMDLPRSLISGTFERAGGLLHPGKLVLGLRKTAMQLGVRIFEHCKVLSLQDGPRVKVLCETGEVDADSAVLATNAYTGSLNRMNRKAAPVIVTLLETDPLTDNQMEAVGWSGGEGIYTAHEILESYHLTARQTIVAGSKQILIPYGSRLKTTNQPSLFRKTTKALRERFPELQELAMKSYWGGYISIALDFLPLSGVTGKHHNIHYGIAYAGHGVAQAIFMGDVLKAAILGEVHAASEVLRRRTYSWPPEPLRWTGGQLLKGVLTLMDKRVDRKVSNQSKISRGN